MLPCLNVDTMRGSALEWSAFLPDRGCNCLDNLCLCVLARTLVQSIDEDSFWLYPLSLLPWLLNRLNNQWYDLCSSTQLFTSFLRTHPCSLILTSLCRHGRHFMSILIPPSLPPCKLNTFVLLLVNQKFYFAWYCCIISSLFPVSDHPYLFPLRFAIAIHQVGFIATVRYLLLQSSLAWTHRFVVEIAWWQSLILTYPKVIWIKYMSMSHVSLRTRQFWKVQCSTGLRSRVSVIYSSSLRNTVCSKSTPELH